MAKVNLGDVILFNWSGKDFPQHAAVATRIVADGIAADNGSRVEDTMTFHEADLTTYNGGVVSNIIGYGSLSGIVGLDALESYRNDSGTAAQSRLSATAPRAMCASTASPRSTAMAARQLRAATARRFRIWQPRATDTNLGAGRSEPRQRVVLVAGWPGLSSSSKNTGRFYRAWEQESPDEPAMFARSVS